MLPENRFPIAFSFAGRFLLLFAIFSNFETRNKALSRDEDDLKEFVLHPDCQIEVVAKEPQVVDPIAIRFDEAGRMWVVEMRDYPLMDSAIPKSRIKILEDKDKDGFFETAHLFADQLLFPTGIQPWKKGVIVTLEGRIVYLADNDGDFRCDEEKLLYSGFASANTQLRANHPTFGPDGKIYVANGLRNGEIQSPWNPKKVSLTGADFRFDPVTLDFERVTGHGQFGLSFDSAGHRFTCTNRNPLKRIVFESEYLESAGGLSISPTVTDVAAAGPESRLYPISETWTTSNLHANTFTAACGVHLFDGTRLPDGFLGNAFTCDPTGNLVHREVISYEVDGVVGQAKPARDKVEFLASTNPYFRPVNLNGGPDGAFYVVDMRRFVIEHPQFMPPELKNRPDLRLGNELGRIYRIKSRADVADWKFQKIDPAKDLFGRNGWRRDQAHRLLVQSPNKADIEKVRAGLTRPESHPNGIIRALSFLASQKAIRPIDYEFAASHYASSVRVFAMRLCENTRPDLIKPGVMDESDAVRFQALLSCVRSGILLSNDELKTVAVNSAQNRWVQQAWLIAAKNRADKLLAVLLDDLIGREQAGRSHKEVVSLCQRLVPLAYRSNPAETQRLAGSCLENALAKNLETLAITFLNIGSVKKSLLAKQYRWKELRDTLRNDIRKKSRVGEQLEPAIFLLAKSGSFDPLINEMAIEEKDPVRRLLALKALQDSSQDEVWIANVKRFRTLTFADRAEVLRACLARPMVARRLLDEVTNGNLKVAELGLDARKRMLKHPDGEIRQLAGKVLAVAVPEDRQKAFKTYSAALQLKSDAKRGRPVFEKTCASCHRLGVLGNQIGPDISDTRTKSKSQLLLDIIRPNAAIDNNFVEYLVGTEDGQSFNGLLMENNATGITLLQSDNRQIVIQKKDIAKMKSTGKSLMPVGLEQGLSVQQVADLISFLQNWRYLEKNIPFSEENNAK